MTQAEKILNHLKTKGTAGSTAKELTDLYIPQYNWCIKWLREHGHVIDSRQERETSGRIRWRFFYRGQNQARMTPKAKHDHNHDGHGNVMVHHEQPRFTME